MKIIAIVTAAASLFLIAATLFTSNTAMERCMESYSRDVCVTSLN